MAGGWASALGAAILGGQQGYQQAKVLQLENNNRALQNAILKIQAVNAPRDIAAKRAQGIYELSPEEAYNNPEFLRLRSEAGEPVNVLPNASSALQSRQLQLAESPDEMKPLASVRGQAATDLGIAPDTGAVVPPELQFARVKREKEMAQLDAQMRMINTLMGDVPGAGTPAGSPGGTPSPSIAASGPTSGTIYDPADVRRRMLYKVGLGVDPASVLGPVQRTPAQIAQTTEAEVKAKKKFAPLSADAQKAVDAMLEWAPHYRGVIDNLVANKMYDPDNPDVGNGILDTGKNIIRRGEYTFHNPPEPYKSLIQETEMSNANMLGGMLHGIRNPQIINTIRAHFPSTYASPASMGDRASAIVAAVPQRIADIYRSEGKDVPPEIMARAQEITKGLKVNPALLRALGSDAAGMQPTATVNPRAAIPPQAPAQPPAGAKQTVPLAKAIAVAKANNIDPKKYIAQLQAEGVQVVGGQ